MKLSRTITLGLSVGAILLFSGCAAGVQCRAPENSTIHIEALKANFFNDTGIIKDRGNPFGETLYENNLKIEGNVVTADKSKKSVLFTWSGLVASWQMKLDADKDTVQIGETIYSCDKGLIELVQSIQEDKNKQESKKETRKISSTAE
jgi:hypothetical protein